MMEIAHAYNNARNLPTRAKTLKVDLNTWNALKNLKKENETFDDIIKDLLDQRTKAIGNDNIKALRYQRKTSFMTMAYGEEVGFEYEYNDARGERDEFTLDLSIRKVFFRRKTYSPSHFFGVDNAHKHFSQFFLQTYFQATLLAMIKEFRTRIVILDPLSITQWRQLYTEYRFSEESFKQDIEEPLRLSIDEKLPKQTEETMKNSPAEKFIKEKGIAFT